MNKFHLEISVIEGESQVVMYAELKQRNQQLERENGFLASELQELRVELAEIRALMGNTPDLVRLLSKNVNDIAARVFPKGKSG